MKRFFLFIAALMLLFTGCDKNPKANIIIEGSPSVDIAEGHIYGSFSFTSNRDWTVEAQDDWISLSPSSGTASDQPVTVYITCDPNLEEAPRSTKVIITAGSTTKEITVTQPSAFIHASGISINPATATMVVGQTLQLSATVTPANATDKTVVWSRDLVVDEAPFEITSDGLVTALSVGECNATATCGEVTANCLITVISGNFTVYVYDGIGWDGIKLYGWDADQESPDEYVELSPVGTREVAGNTFYRFDVPGKWTTSRFGVCFSDQGQLNWSADNYGWCNPGGEYFFHITTPYDANHYASLITISDPSTFVPQPDVPSEPDLPEGTLYYEDFESDDCLEGWTFIDTDNDGYGWKLGSAVMGYGYGLNGSNNLLVSQSYENNTGALTPDNWAFTPAVTLSSSNNQLSLWVCGQDASYAAEHLAVYMTEQIPTQGDIASGCTILMEGTVGSEFVIYTKAQSEWNKYEIPIPDEFNGKTVYFGLRHFNSTDMYMLNIDEIIVTGGE